MVQSAQAPTEFARSVRDNLKTDLTEAKAQGRLTVQDVELAADIVFGIWLQVTRGTLQRRAAPDLADRALDAVLRAIGASPLPRRRGCAIMNCNSTSPLRFESRCDLRWIVKPKAAVAEARSRFVSMSATGSAAGRI